MSSDPPCCSSADRAAPLRAIITRAPAFRLAEGPWELVSQITSARSPAASRTCRSIAARSTLESDGLPYGGNREHLDRPSHFWAEPLPDPRLGSTDSIHQDDARPRVASVWAPRSRSSSRSAWEVASRPRRGRHRTMSSSRSKGDRRDCGGRPRRQRRSGLAIGARRSLTSFHFPWSRWRPGVVRPKMEAESR
jgi:hypothetical protein